MIRAVLDTNVLVSGFTGVELSASAPGEIIRHWNREEFAVILSGYILNEVEETLGKPYFARHFSTGQIADAIQALKRRAIWTEITDLVAGVTAHPDDDLVLATAVSAKAPYLMTGDYQF